MKHGIISNRDRTRSKEDDSKITFAPGICWNIRRKSKRLANIYRSLRAHRATPRRFIWLQALFVLSVFLRGKKKELKQSLTVITHKLASFASWVYLLLSIDWLIISAILIRKNLRSNGTTIKRSQRVKPSFPTLSTLLGSQSPMKQH